MGQNYSINVKTFEEFQDDNKRYYPIVLEALNKIAETAVKGSLQAGEWVIEGNVDLNLFPDMGEDSAIQENEINFTNNTNQTAIYVNWSFSVEKGRVTPDTYTTPGDTEYHTNIIIDDIKYYTEDGSNEFHIVVDDQMSTAVENVLNKLNK